MNTNIAHMLLIEIRGGAQAAIRFPSAEAARDWDDAHPDVESFGCVPVFNRAEALECV